jgi:phage tail tube protein FII
MEGVNMEPQKIKKQMQELMKKSKGEVEEVEVTLKWEMPESDCGKMKDCNSHTKKAMKYKD